MKRHIFNTALKNTTLCGLHLTHLVPDAVLCRKCEAKDRWQHLPKETKISTLKLTDEQIIKKHDPSCRGRAYIELCIVNEIIKQAGELGLELEIDDLTEEEMRAYGNDFKTAVFDLDSATIWVNTESSSPGWMKLVFGNHGYDLVSDYCMTLEEFLKPVNKLADFWGS